MMGHYSEKSGKKRKVLGAAAFPRLTRHVITLLLRESWGRMASLYSLWIHSGLLSTFFTITLAMDSRAILCEGKDSALAEINRNVEMPSECLLSCTAQTYGSMLLRQDTRAVRFKHSYTEKKGEYCWSMHISCNAGESLLQAYVVLPTHVPVWSGDTLGLQTTSVAHKNMLKPHREQTLLPDECGLRFDVMECFTGTNSEPTFCVKVVPQHRIPGGGLRCPPFLVTVWKKQNHSPVNQGEG